ncbi:MAG TPA: hypothetical protein VNA25_25335 [Phycisphaerae bacterium]|nr:hypothetical protein [Phycisphaerae bacterium]
MSEQATREAGRARSRCALIVMVAAGAVVALANTWTLRTGRPLTMLTAAPDLVVLYAINPAAALLAGWLAGRSRRHVAGGLSLAWVAVAFLFGPAVAAGVEQGGGAMIDVLGEWLSWLKVIYLGALAASWAFALRIGAWGRRAPAVGVEQVHG